MRAALIAWMLFALPSRSLAGSSPSTPDTQWWQEIDIVGNALPNLSYLVTGVNRLSDRYPNPVLKGGGAVLTLTQGAFAYSVGYLYADVRLPPAGRNLTAQLPLATVKGWFDFHAFRLSDTVRIEDLIGVPGDPWRFRNSARVEEVLSGLGPLKSLSISDEIFIDTSSGKFTRNRLLAGPLIGLTRHVDLAIAYLNEHDPHGFVKHVRGAFVDLAIHVP